jgi:D-alanine-D-alanine ligase-like ATP-grasp enzyme
MATSLKDDVINVLDQLPQERLAEVLDFALFVKARVQNSTSQRVVAENADALQGIVARSGDATEDIERLYYGRH